MKKKFIEQTLQKNINKFMIPGYRVRVSIMSIMLLENKQREKHTI
jgi:hypothetical protein